ncbi:MAG TPA: hypothetical protein DD438_01175 [Verrucomicrobiales bacterium]|nr:hypothetical protein [Roseibacillus sp.]HBM76693.1 hypothetical protein [Verrucomicrobiales bacterium]HCQ37948.1 hypothetical protein [Verrucomicrobiales bacterium]|tara:strand:- start:2352 stop:2840 length:489 start_codon:yes stop_codon:yes gene_type:complete
MKHSTLFALVLSSMVLLSGTSSRAENLAEILESGGLGTLIGTWVDQDTNGQALSLTYTWRIKDQVLGLSIKMPGDSSEALIAVDPESGEVMHVSADENGGVGMGQWAEENGVAMLTLKTVDSDKKKETVKVSHQIENDKLNVGLQNVTTGDEGEITLVRKSE